MTLQRYLRYLKIAASCMVFAMPALATDQASMSKLNKAEKDFFFQTYENQPLKDRVERLEKRVLGSASSGDVDERLTQVLQAIGSSQEPDMQLENAAQPQSAGTESNTMLPSVRQEDDIDNQDNALTARDTEIRNLLAEGVSLWRNKNLQEAIEKFEQVIRLDANNAEAYFSMGVVSESRGDLKKAIAYYSKAQELDPKKKEYKQASALITKKIASAEPELDKDSQDLLDDANDAFKNKEYLSALDLFKRLEAKNPKVAAYKYNIGTLYLLVKNPFQASEYYKQALKLKPDDPKYQNAYQRVLAMNKANGNINDNLPQQRQPAPPPAQKPILSGWQGGPGQMQQNPPMQQQQNFQQNPQNQQMQQQFQQMPPQQQQQQQQFQPMNQFQQMPPQQMAQMPPQQNQFNQNSNSINQSPLNPQNYSNQIVPGLVQQNKPGQAPMQNQNKPPLDKNGFVKPPHMGQPYKGPGQQPSFSNSKKPQSPGSGILFGIGIEAKAPFPGAGLEVVSIMNGSRAQKAGILPQDSIMAVEGVSVQSVDQANKILTGKGGGQPITIILKRGDRIGQLGI
ncbi:MAG: tetratricopeptide repeat protein [Candidatus Melainabacteria bacterium]|nr:tetratricopeptide repeat protein [Candidatus Melainabacteria bacterium]